MGYNKLEMLKTVRTEEQGQEGGQHKKDKKEGGQQEEGDAGTTTVRKLSKALSPPSSPGKLARDR